MPGLLDLLGLGNGIPPISYPGANADWTGAPPPAVPTDPAAEAQAARELAALRLRLGQRGARAGSSLHGGAIPFQGGAAGLPEPGGAMGGLAGYPVPAGGGAPGQAPAGAPFTGDPFGSIAPALSGGAAPGAFPVTTSKELAPGAPGNPTIGKGDGVPDGVQATPPPLPGPKLDGSVPPSLFSRVGSFLGNNSDALIGLGAGLASGRGWAPGVSRGLTALSTGADADTARVNQNKTAAFLQQRLGVSAEEANAIATNPALLKHNLDYMYAKPIQVKTTDRRGNESTDLVNPFTGQSVLQRTPVRVRSFEEAAALKPGTPFIDPKGQPRMR